LIVDLDLSCELFALYDLRFLSPNTKEKNNFVLSPPEADVCVINPFWTWLDRVRRPPMKIIEYRPIGIIHSPHKTPQGSPIQSSAAEGIEGCLEIFPEFAEGLEDLAGFSHIFLIYHFHLSKKFSLKVKPFLDDNRRGLFATRAPSRPNPIGISVVRLVEIIERTLRIQNVDVVDGTPLLDIKPYVPAFDVHTVEKLGWIGEKTAKTKQVVDDGRFS
jgi:tRNA-Thr(GGU) m(6)t(6)A37 methyltransferase TsaA